MKRILLAILAGIGLGQKQKVDSPLAMEASFKTIFQLTNNGIALLRVDGRIFEVNQSLCDMLGYSEDELLAMNYYYLMHPNHLNDMQIGMQQLIEKKVK